MLPLYRNETAAPKYYKNWLPHAAQVHLKPQTQRAYAIGRLIVGLLLVCGLIPLFLTVSNIKGKDNNTKSAPSKLPKTYTNRFTLINPTVFPAPKFHNLVLVAGHSVYVGHDYATAANETSWYLEPYQQVADSFNWFGHPEVRARAFTEEHARDSFENLLFGLCRFYELTGHYPTEITVVSYTLKRARFEDIHRAAILFPAERFHFVGTPVPEGATGAAEGEARTVEAFRASPYGCTGELVQKRLHRDPFAVGQPHPSRCPDMAQLLQYCEPSTYTGPVPWAQTETAGAGAGKDGNAEV